MVFYGKNQDTFDTKGIKKQRKYYAILLDYKYYRDHKTKSAITYYEKNY